MVESTVENSGLEKIDVAIKSAHTYTNKAKRTEASKDQITPVLTAPIERVVPLSAPIKRKRTLSNPSLKKTLKKANIEMANKNKPDSSAPITLVIATVIKKAMKAAKAFIAAASAVLSNKLLLFIF